MTRRGGREASVRSRGTREDERLPVMARLAARWRRSNLVKLVALSKGNHPSEVQVKRERRKDLYRTERDSLEGLMRKQRYSVFPLETWEKLGLQRRYMLRKTKSAVEGNPKKSWSGIETEAGAE